MKTYISDLLARIGVAFIRLAAKVDGGTVTVVRDGASR